MRALKSEVSLTSMKASTQEYDRALPSEATEEMVMHITEPVDKMSQNGAVAHKP